MSLHGRREHSIEGASTLLRGGGRTLSDPLAPRRRLGGAGLGGRFRHLLGGGLRWLSVVRERRNVGRGGELRGRNIEGGLDGHGSHCHRSCCVLLRVHGLGLVRGGARPPTEREHQGCRGCEHERAGKWRAAGRKLGDGGFERLTDELITGNDVFEFRDGAVQVKQQYFYMIEAVSSNGETRRFGPISLRVDAPSTFALKQNAPNPFNPATTIRFDLPNPTKVTVIVFNILGQEVIRLINDEAMEAGFHEISWNGRNQIGSSTASGIYLYRIEAGEFSKARKMLLLK